MGPFVFSGPVSPPEPRGPVPGRGRRVRGAAAPLGYWAGAVPRPPTPVGAYEEPPPPPSRPDRTGAPGRAVTGRELGPGNHQDKELREVLKDLCEQGWVLRQEGHWGRLYCDCGCTRIQVPGTPRNSGRAARRIRQEARRCPMPPDDPRRGAGGPRE